MSKEPMQPWQTLHREEVLRHSKYLLVESHRVRLPDGRQIDDWPWVVTPDYANVAAITTDGQFLAFRQTKYAVEGVSLAAVGGFIEPGEDPLAAAKRELLEETGYEAEHWDELGEYVVDANRGAGTAHFFLATNARRMQTPSSDDLEEQELLHMSRDEVRAALNRGEFKVLAWSAVLALALCRLDEASDGGAGAKRTL